MEVFQDYAYYYNAFYQDKDYYSEAKQIDALLRKYGNKGNHIINFGCGTGRHDIELSFMGYQCTGIDMSNIMVQIAKENADKTEKNIKFLVADVRTYSEQSKYDAVISLFHVMSYQVDNTDIISTFCSARNVLNPNGLFLFDVWYGPGVLSDKPNIRVKEVEDDKYRLIRIARPVMDDRRNIVDVYYEVLIIDKESNETKTIQELHRMRYFFRPELEFYLKESGFELLDSLDCVTLEKTNYNSWTSYFIARAV